ncbi:hypothetical protein [Roseofilum casamattae]|uniref:Uncharacterized protein n=1 Tax=Roseofilum casamattae BLCC-M143 TaxID=3022442 RepID=A0ABT7BQY9_9CYAN|nr:hypothetical protein [Roseofilum casamattae]MDJ1181586.1 hypothetical protein [Roseofilum casamattae BLCC-M143]
MASSDKKAKSVVVLQSEADFGGTPSVVAGKSPKKKKKKKQDLGMIEKQALSIAKQYDKATTAYREAHEKSNSKKKNGWIMDLPKNYNKALSKLIKF